MFESEQQRIRDATPAPLPFLPVRESVSSWLDELPLAQPKNTLSDMTHALRALRQAALPAAARLELMEMLRPQLLDTQKYLEHAFLDLAYPPPKAAQAKGELLAESCLAALAVFERLRREPQDLEEKGHTRVVQCWFEWAARLQRVGAVLYRRPPQGFWITLYRYYRELEANARDLLAALPSFKRILLFSLTDAHRFDQREIREIDHWSARQAAFLEIGREARRSGHEPAHFGLRLDHDAPPAALERAAADSAGEWRFLWTDGVVDALRQEMQMLQDKGQNPLLLETTRQLLGRLIEEHSAPRRRRGQRHPETATPRIVVGWAQLLAVLPAPETSRLALTPQAERPSEPKAPSISADLLPQIGGNRLRNHEDFEFRQEIDFGRTFDHKFSREDVWGMEGRSAATSVLYHAVKQLDASGDGACLAWEETKTEMLRIGELIGVENAYGGWRVALVRRLQPANDGTWTFGVEFLGNAVRAVAAQHSDPSSREAVLYLPGDAARELPERILAPPRHFSVGAQILLEGAAGTRRMVLYEQVRAAACDCFLAAPSRDKDELALL